MTHDELIAEACRLARESVDNNWGGPFGAVIARDGEIIARGQNRVLLTGDITAHAELEAIRKAVRVINPYSPTISPENQNKSTLAFVACPDGSPDPVPERARMLMGHEIFISGAPCPMCMSAIYWARIDAVYFACDLEDTRKIGFDDAFQFVRTKNETDGGIVLRQPEPVFIKPDITIHLTDVPMGQFTYFQVNKQKAFEDVVIKHQIDIKVIVVEPDVFLPGNKRKSFSQLQQKGLEITDDGLLKR